MAFIKENLNPKGIKTGDCVFRAFAKAFNQDWYIVFDRLTATARTLATTPSCRETVEKELSKYTTIKVFYFNSLGKKKRYTLEQISKWNGTYLVRLANHLAVVKNNNYYDMNDFGKKCAYKIWKVD